MCIARLLVAICMVSALVSVNVFASENGANTTLSTIESPFFDQVKVADTVALPANKKIYVNPVSAKFDRHWMAEFATDTSSAYRAMILKNYAKAMQQHITEQLQQNGWQVLASPNSSSLTLEVQLNNLYINGPEKNLGRHALVKEIGQSSIAIQVKDTKGEVFFEVEDDRFVGGPDGQFIETDNAINFIWFDRLMKTWAITFSSHINAFTGLSAS